MLQQGMEKEILRRLERFQEELRLHDMDGALIVQKNDLYYLSGTDQDAHLWVPAAGEPMLMVRRSMDRAEKDACIRTIVPLRGFSDLSELVKEGMGRLPSTLGLEMDVIPAAFYFHYQRYFKGTTLTDVSPLIRSIRMIKSDYEVSRIAEAAEMADRMFEAVPGCLVEGMTEMDLAARIEACYRQMGHPGVIRTRGFNMECIYGQIMSGANGAVASNSPGPTGGKGPGAFDSQGACRDRIRPHEPIIIDYAANREGYVADQTRIFSMGVLDDSFLRTHDAMLRIQDAVAEEGRAGVRAGDLYALALRMAKESGFQEGFMGYPDPVPFVGHGVGLDIDEWPVIGRGSETLLKEGMTLALEPKVVMPGKGVVGIENTWVVTREGMKKLNRFPDGVVVCS